MIGLGICFTTTNGCQTTPFKSSITHGLSWPYVLQLLIRTKNWERNPNLYKNVNSALFQNIKNVVINKSSTLYDPSGILPFGVKDIVPPQKWLAVAMETNSSTNSTSVYRDMIADVSEVDLLKFVGWVTLRTKNYYMQYISSVSQVSFMWPEVQWPESGQNYWITGKRDRNK